MEEIDKLFSAWYRAMMFDSTGRLGHQERNELVSYANEHQEDLKAWALRELEEPKFENLWIPEILDASLSDNLPVPSKKSLIEIVSLNTDDLYMIRCNSWLNHLKGTSGINYYKDYQEYHNYLQKNYIPWSPNKEDDPNPSYKEFIENRNKYE